MPLALMSFPCSLSQGKAIEQSAQAQTKSPIQGHQDECSFADAPRR
jgi:hypothetical protein